MGFHDERIKQYRQHLKMDDATYQKTISDVFDCILENNPNITLNEVTYLCDALEAEVSAMIEKEQKQAKNIPFVNLQVK